ncbi:MAG: AAA family ATPase [Leptolyngbyaceae cyanobacterium]
MLTKIEIKNYKSICNATIELSPFTLLIGANGAGKSNFIGLLKDLGEYWKSSQAAYQTLGSISHAVRERFSHSSSFQKHFSHLIDEQGLTIESDTKQKVSFVHDEKSPTRPLMYSEGGLFDLSEFSNICVFNIDPSSFGRSEPVINDPVVNEDGTGVTQVLDYLKTGDREDLFVAIENKLKDYVSEIEKLSFISEENSKKLQVREKYIPSPIPMKDLSEGTKFVLAILTILHQENSPSLVCIEDIDRGFHPRLFQQIVELCHDLSRERGIQIIATTHSPYILDEFKGNESAVVIVEKKEGCTTFTTLAERLAQIEANGSEDEMPLGSLWYSGLVGGVPKR